MQKLSVCLYVGQIQAMGWELEGRGLVGGGRGVMKFVQESIVHMSSICSRVGGWGQGSINLLKNYKCVYVYM